ncbi:hypothetical protein L1049_019650 [Liquidambar formosana]|uniref:Uncharacterized protein n=1 Tax=Liquidambar formosana TaxID=63359 RepID=A0AAP0X5F2_LIQFO
MMERGMVDERQIRSPLLVKERPFTHDNGDGGEAPDSGGPATAVVLIATFIAVCGSYVFGTAHMQHLLELVIAIWKFIKNALEKYQFEPIGLAQMVRALGIDSEILLSSPTGHMPKV